MLKKTIPSLSLIAGLLALGCSGLLLIDWYLLPTENGITYLSNISISQTGQGDDIPDGLTVFSYFGALIGACGVTLLAIFQGSLTARSGFIALIALTGFSLMLMSSAPIPTIDLLPFFAGILVLLSLKDFSKA